MKQRLFTLPLALACLTFSMASCDDDVVDEASHEIDEAADETADAIDDVADELGD